MAGGLGYALQGIASGVEAFQKYQMNNINMKMFSDKIDIMQSEEQRSAKESAFNMQNKTDQQALETNKYLELVRHNKKDEATALITASAARDRASALGGGNKPLTQKDWGMQLFNVSKGLADPNSSPEDKVYLKQNYDYLMSTGKTNKWLPEDVSPMPEPTPSSPITQQGDGGFHPIKAIMHNIQSGGPAISLHPVFAQGDASGIDKFLSTAKSGDEFYIGGIKKRVK